MPNVKLPDGSIASFPDGTDPSDMLRAIQQHAAQAASALPKGPGTPGYSGSVLPVSVDEQGNPRFDANAGLVGTVLRSFRAPGDVATGKLPITNPTISTDAPGGTYNPEMLTRAGELAALISPPNPAVRAGDFAIPGEMRAGTVPSRVPPPTATQLKGAADVQYKAARDAGLDISGNAVADLATGLKAGLQSGPGVIPKTAPKTFAILDELSSPPKDGFATISGLEAARRGLSSVKMEGGTEGLAAGHAVRGIDDFLSTLGDSAVAPSSTATAPAQEIADLLRTGRANYAAAMRSNDITGVLDRANTGISERAATRAAATNSGQNIDNALRQRVASLLEKPREVAGFSDPEIEALQKFVEGGGLRNAARRIGNVFGGGGGLGQIVAGAVGGGVGGAAGGWPGFAVGSAAPTAVGVGAKALENSIAKRQLAAIDQLIRSRSPLFEETLAAQPRVVPGLDSRALLLRLLASGAGQGMPMWGALAPPGGQNANR